MSKMEDEQESWQRLSDQLGELVTAIKRFEEPQDRAIWLSGRDSENLAKLERCLRTLEEAWEQFYAS